jgi:hypothetical protein
VNEFTGLIQKINDTVRSDRNQRIALSSVLAIHKQRIFVQGFDAKGQKIGTYSTKPISIARSKQARDTGRTVFKGGYSEYKTAIGKNPGFINLRNTDQLMMDYGLIGQAGRYGFGFQNTENFNKAQWVQDKKVRDVFDLSKNEENVLADILVDQLIKGIK